VSVTPSDGEIIDRLYGALADGDVTAARACCTDDLQVWHSFDQKIVDLQQTLLGWQQLVDGFPERSFVDVRRAAVPGGWVQRHQMVARTPDGKRLAWPLCLFVTTRDGLVCGIDEYIDRAGTYEIGEDVTTTTGLPPSDGGGVLS
jgi:ketosteroid isomerase-like protein